MSKWVEARLDEVANRVAVKNSARHDRVLTVSAEHGLVDQEKFFNKRVASADLSGYWVVQPGDFVYNKSTSKDAPWGVVARYDGDAPAVVTSLYIVFRARPEIVHPEFLLLACNGKTFFDSLRGMLREGARAHGLLNVRLNEFFGATVSLPDLFVQRRIVDVMAAVDTQIEALTAEVHAQSRVFRLVVTEMTALGEDSVPLTEVAENLDNKRIPVSQAERDNRGGKVPYYGAAGRTGWIDRPIFDEPLVCLGEDGAGLLNWRTKAIAYRIDGPSWVNNHAHVLRATGVSTEWLALSLMHYDISLLVNDGTRPKLNKGVLDRILIRVPKDDVEELALSTMKDGLRAATIELAALRAFRSALLTSLLSQDTKIPESYDNHLDRSA